MLRLLSRLGFVLLCMMVSGCGPTLNLDQQMVVDPNDIRTIIVDAIDQEQELKVVASSTEPIHVHVYLPKDESAIDAAVTLGKAPAEALAGAMNEKEHTLGAKVPAGQEARIRIQSASGNTAKVTLKVNN